MCSSIAPRMGSCRRFLRRNAGIVETILPAAGHMDSAAAARGRRARENAAQAGGPGGIARGTGAGPCGDGGGRGA
jgi:hypothetical protein